jgi:ATP-binding cassette subfamily B protein
MTRRELRFIVDLWRPFWWVVALIVSLSAVASLTTASLPVYLARVFDVLAAPGPGRALSAAVLAYAAVAALEWALQTTLMFARGTMNDRFEWAARSRVFDHVIRHGPSFFQRHRTGDLVTRLSDDVSEKLCWFCCSGIFRALVAAGVVAFAIVRMASLDPWLAGLVTGPLPLFALLYVRTGSVLEARYEAVQARLSEMSAALEATLSGIRAVKAYGREAAQGAAFARRACAVRDAEVRAARAQVLMDQLYGHLWQLGIIAVLVVGGLQVMSGRVTLGTFVAFQTYAIMMVYPMLDLGTFVVRGRQAVVSIDRLLVLEEAPPAVVESPGARVPATPPRGHLEVDHATVRHEAGARAVLHDVSLQVRPGEVVAVAGRIGSGKSTLLRLVPRLVDPSSGRLLLDGTDLRDLPLLTVRAAVGLAPQEAFLFSDTIRENVRFARPDVTDDAVAWACGVARLEEELRGFAAGLETRVGARGLTLSGGQRQRVALARALAGRPRILVLDDVTSALDAETEAALWDELERALPGAATLVVTHRVATLERADRVVVLEAGRVVETGTHAALVRAGGHYRAIYSAPR